MPVYGPYRNSACESDEMTPDEPMGIAEAARRAKCSEWTLRRLDYQGIVQPARDPWGRRLYTSIDIESARQHLAARRTKRSHRSNG